MGERIILRIDAEDASKETRPAPCADCGKETEPRTKSGRPFFKQWDAYLLRDEVWAEAGMRDEWRSGFLCTPCLRARLGRDLTDDDYMQKPLRATSSYIEGSFAPEYVDRVLNGRGY